MAQKIIFCKGLPASGKSTWAKEFILYHPEFIRVNKDDLRELFGNPLFNRDFEDAILDIERKIGKTALSIGKSLIVDDTNFAKKHETFWSGFAVLNSIKFEIMIFDTPVEECIQRDSEREKSVGKDVIMGMYKNYIEPNI